MKFEKHTPTLMLQPYIKFIAVSGNATDNIYKVFPSAGLVLGFQYKGRLATIHNDLETSLSTAGITGITDSFKLFKNISATSSILVYFTEVGFAYFSKTPVNELFNQSISLDHLFDKNKIAITEEKLAIAKTDQQRINIVEQFLLSELKQVERDKLIIEAVKIIYASKGNIKIKELNKQLCISQSPFEKRFRKLVGTSPKKFASIVRFNTVLNQINNIKSLTDICYENNFFDQAHFIKDFKKYTDDTPENFKHSQK